MHEVDDEVHVEFEHGGERSFDLVIGADGLRSRVRKLVFGPQDRYEKDLGYRVAAFETAGYWPRNELVYVHGAPGRQVGRFTLHNDRTLFLFIFGGGGEPEERGVAGQKGILRKTFAGDAWELPTILATIDTATTSTSIASVKSAWMLGRTDALRWSATLAFACLFPLARRGFGDDGGLCSGRRTGDITTPAAGGIPPIRGAVATPHPWQAASRGALCHGVRPADPARVFFRNQVIKAFRVPAIARIAIGRDP